MPQKIPAGEEPLLTYEELARRRVVQLRSVTGGRALRLVKLYDEGLAAAKVDNRIATEDDYATLGEGLPPSSGGGGRRRLPVSVHGDAPVGRAVRALRGPARWRSGDATAEACRLPGRRA